MSTKRTCITCTAKSVNKEEVPLWSKQDGLYSTLPKVITCEDTYNPRKRELTEETPEIVGSFIEAPLAIKETNQWIFYWATEAGASLDGDKPEAPATSYGQYSNRGLTKSDKDGNATLKLNCPTPYKEEGQLYPRHVHYTVLTKDDVWSTKIGTLEIMCKVSTELMQTITKNKTYLIVNALTKESYDKQHIPNSVLLNHEMLDGLTKQKKSNIIQQYIKDLYPHYPKLQSFVDETGSIKDIPIIIYCAHEECEASAKLSKHLFDSGFFNVMEYPGGLKGWFSEPELFSDIQSDSDIESDSDDEGEETLDKYTKIPDNEEMIVYDGVEYIHDLDSSEILLHNDKRTPVGMYEGDEIEWNSSKEYRNHLKRIKVKGGGQIDHIEGNVSDSDSDSDSDTDTDTDSEELVIGDYISSDEEDDWIEEGNKLNDLLNSIGNRPTMKHCKLGGGTYESDKILYGGGYLTQSSMNNTYNGWGFTWFQ
jgi:rhodanese-related sulfurtransferase